MMGTFPKVLDLNRLFHTPPVHCVKQPPNSMTVELCYLMYPPLPIGPGGMFSIRGYNLGLSPEIKGATC